jgi:hypothetical protein
MLSSICVENGCADINSQVSGRARSTALQHCINFNNSVRAFRSLSSGI